MANAPTAIRRGRRKGGLREYIVMGVTLAVVLLFSASVQGFTAVGNLQVIASNSTALSILSCGMRVVIISRALDLSVVAIMVAGAAAFATLSNAGCSGPSAPAPR